MAKASGRGGRRQSTNGNRAQKARSAATATRPKASRPKVEKASTATRKQLPETQEKSLEATVETAFGSKSADFRKGAVIYARKLLKYDRGLRESKPPVPPVIQGNSREATRKTCASIAEAFGLDAVKLGLADEPADPKAEVEPKAEVKREAKPDPKASGK